MMYGGKTGNYPVKLQRREAEPPQTMIFKDETGGNPVKFQKREAQNPQTRKHKDKTKNNPVKVQRREAEPPQMMFYKDKTRNNPLELQKREAVHPQMIIYKDKTRKNAVKHQKREGEPPQKSVYDVPQVMMYGNKFIPSKLRQIMVNNKPQMMVYIKALMVMYCDKIRPLNLRQKSTNHPQMMVYNEPQMVRYGDKILPSQLLKLSLEYPQIMVYTTPQSMSYNGEKDHLTKRYLKEQPEELSLINKSNASSIETNNLEYFDPYIHLWCLIAESLSLKFPEEDVYFKSWSQRIVLFNYSQLNRSKFTELFPRLPLHVMIEELSLTNIFQNLFWQFSFDQAFMNQKLALSGMSGFPQLSLNRKKDFTLNLRNIKQSKYR
ncbi:uncharacterized protein LOC128231822 [Mya arenaria]|uniref:uncharacterized protein LOC128231822 n=1 Tax=Mya arenaria TaxID=6604 RepID=UPI0022E71EBE|nr:uncharacterized protein LOC128231822 [Mya arenaria]